MYSSYAVRTHCGDKAISELAGFLKNRSGTMAERTFQVFDVSSWSWEDCYLWFDSVHVKYQLPIPRFHPRAFQDLNGYILLQFNEVDFHYRAPSFGNLFYREFKKFLLCKNKNPDTVLDQMMKTYDFGGVAKEELDIYLNEPKKGGDWLSELLSKPSIKLTKGEIEAYLQGINQITSRDQSGLPANCMGAESLDYSACGYQGNQCVDAGYGYPCQNNSSRQSYPNVSSSSTQWSPVAIGEMNDSRMGTPNSNIDASRNYQNMNPVTGSQPGDGQPALDFCLMTTSPNASNRKKEFGIEPWQLVVLTLVKGRTDLVQWEDRPTYSINLVNPQALTDMWNVFYRGSNPQYTNIARCLKHIYPAVDQHEYGGKNIYRLEPIAIQFLHKLQRDS